MRRNYTLHGQFLRKAQVFIHILVLWHRLPSPRKKRGQTSQSKPSLGGARSLHCTPGKQGLLSHASNSETIWKLVVDILRRLTTDFCVTKQITNLFWLILSFVFLFLQQASVAREPVRLTDLRRSGRRRCNLQDKVHKWRSRLLVDTEPRGSTAHYGTGPRLIRISRLFKEKKRKYKLSNICPTCVPFLVVNLK